jgi:hypothetical protein
MGAGTPTLSNCQYVSAGVAGAGKGFAGSSGSKSMVVCLRIAPKVEPIEAADGMFEDPPTMQGSSLASCCRQKHEAKLCNPSCTGVREACDISEL